MYYVFYNETGGYAWTVYIVALNTWKGAHISSNITQYAHTVHSETMKLMGCWNNSLIFIYLFIYNGQYTLINLDILNTSM